MADSLATDEKKVEFKVADAKDRVLLATFKVTEIQHDGYCSAPDYGPEDEAETVEYIGRTDVEHLSDLLIASDAEPAADFLGDIALDLVDSSYRTVMVNVCPMGGCDAVSPQRLLRLEVVPRTDSRVASAKRLWMSNFSAY